MSQQNKIFTTLNQPLEVQFYSLVNPDASALLYSTLEGLPIGTADNTQDGELGVKVIVIADRTTAAVAAGGIATVAVPTYTEGSTEALSLDLSGRLRVVADLKVSDIEIGQVELKDGSTATNAIINAANTARTTATPTLVVQVVDAAGGVLSAANLATIAGWTLGTGVRDATTQRVTIATNDVLPLPSGASTAAKQPALGTASAPSTDVLTAQTPAVTKLMDTALAASKVLKASAGQIRSLIIFNSKATAQFALLMDSAAVPADGAVTLLVPPIPLPPNSWVQIEFMYPVVAVNGIAVSNSSTGTFTKTIGSADCVFFSQVN